MIETAHTQVQDLIFAPAGIDDSHLEQLASVISGSGIDIADAYFENSRMESWSLEDGIIKEGSYSIEQGCGIRIISGEKTGFAYTDNLQHKFLLNAANTAKAIVRSGQSHTVALTTHQANTNIYPAINPLNTLTEHEKIELLKEIDQTARQYDPRIKQVMASLVAVHDVVAVLDNSGHLFMDSRPLMRVNIHIIAEQNGRIEQGSGGGGGRRSMTSLLENDLHLKLTKDACRQALVNLEAVDAPAGSFPVVLGSGWPGVLLHEAVGHGLEGDFNRKGSSAFSGKIGEKVAADNCTVVDDGTMENRRGSLNIDDEGTASENTVLIENGILKAYMQDKMNAKLMNTRSTGNGRRESFAHLPMPRMTNTYMLPGQHDPEEIIQSVEKGIYAVNFGGGQVDITSGKFVFSANEAYLIENGKVTSPVKGATLIGNGPEVMTRISMIGNDLQLDPGIGVCGKEGQSVPVGVGQPTLKIDELTVGGTAT
jgi:TldD protein